MMNDEYIEGYIFGTHFIIFLKLRYSSSLSFRCATRRLCRRKKGEETLALFFYIWVLPKYQKNKASVQKIFFAAEGGYLATKKTKYCKKYVFLNS